MVSLGFFLLAIECRKNAKGNFVKPALNVFQEVQKLLKEITRAFAQRVQAILRNKS